MKGALSIAFSLLGLVSTVAQGAPAREVGLRSALTLAIRHSLALETLHIERDIALNEQTTAKRARLPKLELDSTLAAGAGAGYEDRPLRHSSGISLSSSLYDAGNMGAALEQADLALKVKDVEIRIQTEELLLKVLELFGELRLRKASLEFERESYRRLEEQARVIERAFKQGLKKQGDFVQVELDLKSAEVRLSGIKTDIEKTETKIKEALSLGFDEKWTFSVDELAAVHEKDLGPLPSWSELQPLLLEGELLAARHELEKARTDFAKRAEYPDLTAKAFAGFRNEFVGDDFIEDRDSSLSTEISLNFNYPLWDWGTRQRELQNALSREKIAELGKEAALLELRSQYEALVTERAALKENLELAREIARRAEQAFKISKEGYRLGQISYLGLADSYRRLFSARESLLSQENALRSHINTFLKLKGQLYATWVP